MFTVVSVNAQDFWTEYATSQPAASTGVASISIVNANVSWLNMSCGTTGCTPIRRYARSLDAGLTYNTGVIDLGAASASLRVANIHAFSADVAWASVFPAAAGATGGVWKTVNAGANWTRQATASFNDTASFTNIVYFWDENQGVTMGDPTSGAAPYFEIYTTTNGGTNWTRTPSGSIPVPSDPQEYGLTNKFTALGNSIWIGTTFGRILKSTDKGLTWTITQSPIPDFGGGINGSENGDLIFETESVGLLVTSDYLIYSTTDGGTTWNPVTYTGPFRNFGTAQIPTLAGTYVSVGEDVDSGERGSSYTQDGGVTWINIEDANAVDGGIISFLSPATGFVNGFSTSAAVGGIFRWNGLLPILANETFSYNTLKASPNPTTGLVALTGKNITNVIVTDLLGKQISNTKYTSLDSINLDITSYNAGMYMVKVTNADGVSSTIKVVKQ